ncbi:MULTISPECIES: TRM11 family SAM-dependent methyltransferase [unclassified Peribacillus]|uniref:TRM11 family SAM-dependent methyltransferase n=1 Tax=unclassified Peribacillus TaxID=2675266 RepID=UPI0019136936|nr:MULTISPECIES: RNA methyltransferase [unclassified Peribacillus]MBK5445579.1 RNA methyltransferase [Peribacillus sp. TH24]MBK5459701.1 RNA methyltransferase [Peribacillus sp. TH27]MBK5497891.1 RNA methyltransferase [Peribacillus sp. TH14]
MNNHSRLPAYIYTFTCSPDERSLCNMEMRSFFGLETSVNILKSNIEIEPSRSPFIKGRVEVMYEGESISEIVEQVKNIHLPHSTFKVLFVKINDLDKEAKIDYDGQREIEREIGWHIQGNADVRNPDQVFGIVPLGGRWYFGKYVKPEAVWLHHMKKPREYSTALSTRVARAIANIAVPHPDGVKAIDPCCGIGTVLVEALSMGIDIDGRDINPLVTDGSRENIAYFGLEGDVTTGPISDVTKNYDVAIIDMPYNLYTHATPEDQLSILKHAKSFADKVVVVTIDTMDHMIEEAGFEIADRCVAKKGIFSRQIVLCV